jgi:transcriptional regulator
MTSGENSDRVADKLNTLIKITVASAFKDASKEERILILLDIGISRKEVADIVGTTVQYVDNVKHKAKKEVENKAKHEKVGKKSAEK